jgi:glycogen operon protein
MLLDGRHILERDARGEPIVGDTLLVLFNGSPEADIVIMPASHGDRWTRLADTAFPTDPALTISEGSRWTVPARSASIWMSEA